MEQLRKLGSTMQRDFCPGANRWFYWLKNPFWSILLAAMAAGICAYGLNVWLWIPTIGLLLIAVGGLLLPMLAVRGIDLTVYFDVRRTEVGQPVVVRLGVKNRGWFPVWGLSIIRGLSTIDSVHSEEGVGLSRVPARSEVEYTWQFEPTRRGEYPLEAVEVEIGFPFGLIRASRPATVHGSLIVWPRTVPLKGLPDAAESHAEDELSPRRAGHFGDIIGTRAFWEGDPLRRVHWAQSARRQTLIVTERQAPQSSMVRVLVDLSEASHRDSTEDTTECLIATAASICRSLHEQHCRVECYIADKAFVAGEASYSYHRMMDEFAVCQPGAAMHQSKRAAGFEIVVTTSQGHHAGRTVRVLAPDESVPADAWLDVAGWDGLQDELPQAWKGVCHVS